MLKVFVTHNPEDLGAPRVITPAHATRFHRWWQTDPSKEL